MTTVRAVSRSESLSEPLPHLHELSALYALGFRPRRGEVIVVGGRSGAAKSSFMIWLAVTWNLPTLYYSLDQNLGESTHRALAAHTGNTVDEVDQLLREGRTPPDDQAPICWCFDRNPGINDLQDELDAYVESYDAWPEIIVVDNLIDVFHGREGDKNGYDDTLKFLKEKAFESNAAVFVLAHTSALVKPNDPFTPQPKYALLDKPDKHPQGILMVALNPKTGEFRVSVAKSRMSLSDESSEDYASLRADQARCSFSTWYQGYQYAS